MKTLLQALQTRLMATVPLLKYIDEDWAQLDAFGDNMPVRWPCVLLDISNASWQNQGNGMQIGVLQVRVLVANLKLTNSSSKAPAAQKSKAFEIFEIMESVHQALHGFAAIDEAGPCTRISTKKVRRTDMVQVFEMVYSIQINDKSAVPEKFKWPVQAVQILPV